MELALFVAIGGVAGILSAMLGIGGGQVLVPCLVAILTAKLPPDLMMKVVLATSLATIPFTGAWAAYQQRKAGNVDFTKVAKVSLGVVFGALGGGYAAPFVPGTFLRGLFCFFAFYVGGQMLAGRHPKFKASFSSRSAVAAGAITGALSSWVGIGGGAIIVPYLLSVGEEVKKATGISSAVGVVVAAAASAGYAFAAHAQGIHEPGLLGFVHISAFLGIVTGSFFGVLIGMRLAAKAPAALIKRIFAVTLLASGAKMLWGLFF